MFVKIKHVRLSLKLVMEFLNKTCSISLQLAAIMSRLFGLCLCLDVFT